MNKTSFCYFYKKFTKQQAENGVKNLSVYVWEEKIVI